VVVAARSPAASLPAVASLSLFTDRGEGEIARMDAQAAEVIRQDDLLHERDAELARKAAHVRHLEEIAAYRERIVVERDAQLVEVQEAHAAEREALNDER